MGSAANLAKWALPLGVLLAAAGGFAFMADREAEQRRFRALSGRGSVLWDSDQATPEAIAGSSFVLVSASAAVGKALSEDDVDALIDAMRAAGQQVLVVDVGVGKTTAGGLRGRFESMQHVHRFRGLYLAPDIAVYEVDRLQALDPKLRLALATVARGMLSGKRAPRLASFPEPLREVQHVEVMVMLRAGGRPRLWRSARGSSLGRALLTATRVAKSRWAERRSAMGEPLRSALERMDVEVSLLQDDGRLGSRAPAFIERAFGPEHGVAFERKGAWRYLLPGATRAAGKGSAMAAFVKLLGDEGLEPGAFDAADLDPYRLSVNLLAVSPAPGVEPEPDDEIGPVLSPDEIVAPGPGGPGKRRGSHAGDAPEPDDEIGPVLSPDEILEPRSGKTQ